MGKRYFCDYCDRSFQDNMHNRKKHLNGVQHHRAKKAWFDIFKDPETILLEEQAKKPCRKFLQKGICDFGPNCRFSHMSEGDLFFLRQQVEGENSLQEHFEHKILHDRNIEDWLARREKKKNALCSKEDLKTDTEECPEESNVPQQLLAIPNLPPSLRPPPPGGWKVSLDREWG